jgi:hypothetical protein
MKQGKDLRRFVGPCFVHLTDLLVKSW